MPLLSGTWGLGLGFRNMPRAHRNDMRSCQLSSWPLLVVQPWGYAHLSHSTTWLRTQACWSEGQELHPLGKTVLPHLLAGIWPW